MYAHVPYDCRCLAAVLRLALCAVFLRSLSAYASTHLSSYAVLHLAAVLRLVPCLIPWNRAKSASFQSLLHDVMVREKSVIMLFCCKEFYVSEFYCIR